MVPPMTAEETTVIPNVMTRTLTVSHTGPSFDRRYWQTVSSQAQLRPLRRLKSVRSSSQRKPPDRGMAAPVVGSRTCAMEFLWTYRARPAGPTGPAVPLSRNASADKWTYRRYWGSLPALRQSLRRCRGEELGRGDQASGRAS